MLMHCFHPHLDPLPSRERGIRLVVLACCLPRVTPTLWIPDHAGMTVRDAGSESERRAGMTG